ncbi:enoyl-CoA hydratase-related protein [Aquihabitans sp. McL0605]|uniref:enoyl-CoA hydratase-related protein n=1 Tax=Aquihabitans sp. McL0605 TaxID=3415671 RepID=UPI003CEE81F5
MELDELRTIRLERDGGVAIVTLDRPDRMNAWTGRMHTEYLEVFARLEADPTVRAAVVTGAGRAFCAGADTSALEGHVAAGGYDRGLPPEPATPGHGVRTEYDHAFAWHYGLRFPVVAAVNGAAAGVGLVLACYCDLRFVADEAKLTTSAPRLGLPAEYGLSWVLPRLVGTGHAADLLISSRVVRGPEAERMGLANRSLPAADVLPAALNWARAVATEVSPASAALAKAQLYADLHRDVGQSVATSERLLDETIAGADYAEGVAAWMARRPPAFADLPAGPGPRL